MVKCHIFCIQISEFHWWKQPIINLVTCVVMVPITDVFNIPTFLDETDQSSLYEYLEYIVLKKKNVRLLFQIKSCLTGVWSLLKANYTCDSHSEALRLLRLICVILKFDLIENINFIQSYILNIESNFVNIQTSPFTWLPSQLSTRISRTCAHDLHWKRCKILIRRRLKVPAPLSTWINSNAAHGALANGWRLSTRWI